MEDVWTINGEENGRFLAPEYNGNGAFRILQVKPNRGKYQDLREK